MTTVRFGTQIHFSTKSLKDNLSTLPAGQNPAGFADAVRQKVALNITQALKLEGVKADQALWDNVSRGSVFTDTQPGQSASLLQEQKTIFTVLSNLHAKFLAAAQGKLNPFAEEKMEELVQQARQTYGDRGCPTHAASSDFEGKNPSFSKEQYSKALDFVSELQLRIKRSYQAMLYPAGEEVRGEPALVDMK
jgi:hypothetical protein